MYIIKCDTLAEFVTVCAGLVREGITFDAHAPTLKIECTGGF